MKARTFISVCLFNLIAGALLFMGPMACETLYTGDSAYDHSRADRSRIDHEYDRAHYDYDYDRDYDRDRDQRAARAEMRVYDYYPLREVYYNRTTQEYTYWNNGKLERRHELPSYIKDSMGKDHYTLRLPGDDPERYHDRIKRNYPGGDRGDYR